ncbi:delta(3,5)-Delta(2,4)-dienoyl-CoA isomerase, peroxisomal-like [Bidens hawaiensis]|uniref:delta(3,5)-Delta(2,4)-dienoyl-CoA isomerase, peroxisomal-like n=1 Tax=Bidens hawaiensis TaxID=980011 RepID=UPI00404A6D17
MENYSSVEIVQQSPSSPVFTLYLNRPLNSNALTLQFFSEFPKALSYLDQNPNVAVIILSGKGKHFCAGIDLKSLTSLTADVNASSDRGRSAEKLRRQIKFMQDAITAIENCRKPVIACIHGACIGGGVDIVTACDVRYCTEDALFSVKEVDLAITADLGSLQRLPEIVGYGKAMELALTGRRFSGSEAESMGLVSKAFGCKADLEEGVRAIAEGIGAKSPLAVTGTKRVMLKSRDLTLNQGLDYVATWNSAMLLSSDLEEVVSAQLRKTKPSFSKL